MVWGFTHIFAHWGQITTRLSTYLCHLTLSVLMLGIYDTLPFQKHDKLLLFYTPHYTREEILNDWCLASRAFLCITQVGICHHKIF